MTNVEQRNNQYHQIYKENNQTCIPNVDKSTLDIFHLSMVMEADLFQVTNCLKFRVRELEKRPAKEIKHHSLKTYGSSYESRMLKTK